VFSTSSNYGWFVSWDNGTVGEGDEGASWGSSTYGENTSSIWGYNWASSDGWGGNSWSSNSWGSKSWTGDSWGSSVGENWGSSGISGTSGSQVVGSGGYNRWGISWGDSSIWVSYQTSSTGWKSISKRTGVTVGYSWDWGNSWDWSGNSWDSGGDYWSWGNSTITVSSTITISSTIGEGWSSSSISGTFSSQVVGSGSNNRWGISWGYSTVWVSYQTSSTGWETVSKWSMITISSINTSWDTSIWQDGAGRYGEDSRDDNQKLHFDYLVGLFCANGRL